MSNNDELSRCVECGREFRANDKNSVDLKIMGFYVTVCKPCAKRLFKKGKIRVLKEGAIKL